MPDENSDLRDEVERVIEGLIAESHEREGALQDSIAYLEDRLEAVRDARDEERFCWTLVVFIVIDMFAFPHLNNWGSALAILFLQIVLLTILGKKLGVEDIVLLTDKILGSLNGNRNKD